MRWILVFIILYLIPLVVIFRNYKSFRRACIYGSIYVTLATTIVITNIYLSGLKVIEETLDVEDNRTLETYIDKYESDNYTDESKNDLESKEENNDDNKIDEESNGKTISENEKKDVSEEVQSNLNINASNMKSDLNKIFDFKKDVYTIERVALIPMRECLPYTNNLQKSLSNLSQVKDDVLYAKEMCEDVVDIYDKMVVPDLSKDEYTKSLDRARVYVKKTYELRTKAMENAIKLIETKNPMYINKITSYLKQSDKEISNFKKEINILKENINKK